MNNLYKGPSKFEKGQSSQYQYALLKKMAKHAEKVNHKQEPLRKDDHYITINDYIRPLEFGNRIFIYRDVHNYAIKCNSTFIKDKNNYRYKKSFMDKCILNDIFIVKPIYKNDLLKKSNDQQFMSVDDFIKPLEIHNTKYIYRDIHNFALKRKSTFIKKEKYNEYKKSFLLQCIEFDIFTIRWDYKIAMLNLKLIDDYYVGRKNTCR